MSRTVTSREQAKQYLASHRIPQLFESLLSCLMVERPDDPVAFIEAKMSQIKQIGVKNVNWETFVINLHPYRDPVRREFVRDGSKFDREREEEERKLKEKEQEKLRQPNEAYRPDVFQLTESADS